MSLFLLYDDVFLYIANDFLFSTPVFLKFKKKAKLERCKEEEAPSKSKNKKMIIIFGVKKP